MAPSSGTKVPAATPINNSNIIGAMKARKIVIIRGLYEKAKGKTSHWMLATMFTTDKNGATNAIAANDPWTGRQVLIDAATKRVIWPADFPLKNFTVDTYVLATP